MFANLSGAPTSEIEEKLPNYENNATLTLNLVFRGAMVECLEHLCSPEQCLGATDTQWGS